MALSHLSSENMGGGTTPVCCWPSQFVSLDPFMLFGRFSEEEACRKGRVEGVDARYG